MPYRYMFFPCARFFIAIGVYSTNNSLFEVNEVLVFGIVGAIFLALDFPVAPILLGYVLAQVGDENLRRALLLSRGDLTVFFQRLINLGFMTVCILLILLQVFVALRASGARGNAAHRSLDCRWPAALR